MAKISTSLRLSVGDVSPRRVAMKDIAQQIVNVGRYQAEANTIQRLRTLQRIMEKAGNDEAKRLIPFVTRILLSIPSSMPDRGVEASASWKMITSAEMETWADEIYQRGSMRGIPGAVRWRNLSPAWMKKKGFRKPFFVGETGELKRELQAMRMWPISTLGGVVVTLKQPALRPNFASKLDKTQGRDFLLGQFDIQIFPNATGAQFPGLLSGRWSDVLTREQAPGLSDDMREKLNGPRPGSPFYRPMLTPAAQFWALYRIPAALKDATTRALSRASGIAEYSTSE